MDRYIMALIFIVAGVYGLYLVLTNSPRLKTNFMYTKWIDCFGEKGTRILFTVLGFLTVLAGLICLFA